MKNLLSPAVNRGDLRRLNYNKPVLSRGHGEHTETLPWPESGGQGMPSPLSSRDPLAPRSLSELLVPNFLDQSYAPFCVDR